MPSPIPACGWARSGYSALGLQRHRRAAGRGRGMAGAACVRARPVLARERRAAVAPASAGAWWSIGVYVLIALAGLDLLDRCRQRGQRADLGHGRGPSSIASSGPRPSRRRATRRRWRAWPSTAASRWPTRARTARHRPARPRRRLPHAQGRARRPADRRADQPGRHPHRAAVRRVGGLLGPPHRRRRVLRHDGAGLGAEPAAADRAHHGARQGHRAGVRGARRHGLGALLPHRPRRDPQAARGATSWRRPARSASPTSASSGATSCPTSPTSSSSPSRCRSRRWCCRRRSCPISASASTAAGGR